MMALFASLLTGSQGAVPGPSYEIPSTSAASASTPNGEHIHLKFSHVSSSEIVVIWQFIKYCINVTV